MGRLPNHLREAPSRRLREYQRRCAGNRFLGTRPDSDIDLGQEDFGTVQTLYRPIQENVVVVRNPARAHSAGDTLINHLFRK